MLTCMMTVIRIDDYWRFGRLYQSFGFIDDQVYNSYESDALVNHYLPKSLHLLNSHRH